MTSLELADFGSGAPPRANGELIFDAPWQSRLFGLTEALVEDDTFSWADFQAALIAQVGERDLAGLDTGEPDVYWKCWLDGLATVAESVALVEPVGWSARCVELAARPAGHDH